MPQRATRLSPLANFQREATKALATLQKEITQRERELAALKGEASRWQSVLRGSARGDGSVAITPSRAQLSKQPRLDWDAIFKDLPSRFTPKDIAQKAGKPIAHAYTYVARWMKDK